MEDKKTNPPKFGLLFVLSISIKITIGPINLVLKFSNFILMIYFNPSLCKACKEDQILLYGIVHTLRYHLWSGGLGLLEI